MFFPLGQGLLIIGQSPAQGVGFSPESGRLGLGQFHRRSQPGLVGRKRLDAEHSNHDGQDDKPDQGYLNLVNHRHRLYLRVPVRAQAGAAAGHSPGG